MMTAQSLPNRHLMREGTFPVVYSTLSCEALVGQVLSQYAIAPVVDCRIWNHGLSDVYQVQTEDNRYILRVSHAHWRNYDEVAFELGFLEFLYGQQLPVAYPLRTHEGTLCIEIPAPEGKRYASLFSYAQGEVPLGDFNTQQARKFGETLARIHVAGYDFDCDLKRPPLTLEYLLVDSLRVILPFFKQRPDDWAYLQDASEQIQDQLLHLPKAAPFWSVCWGDPHSGNAHFTLDTQLTLFDFDQCGYGWRAFDLAKFLQVSLRTGMSKSVRESFFRGYQTVQDLEPCELDAIHPLTQVAHLWNWAISLQSACWHGYCRLDNTYFTQRLEQLKRFRSQDWQLF